MKRIHRIAVMAAGLALLPVCGALAAAINPGAPNPYPTRESKLLADFETDIEVTSDPNGAGENVASIVTDAQVAADGTKALKLDLTGVTAGWHGNAVVFTFPEPIDIKDHKVLSMDIFIPEDSIESSWYQFHAQPTWTTSDTDESAVASRGYGPGNVARGWTHMIWPLQNGTDTKLTQLAFSLNSGADWLGPVYVDNIRLYKGDFVGLQPDQVLIQGFDKASDKDLFYTLGDFATFEANTDKQFISHGEGSLKIDLAGHPGSWNTNSARVDDFGTTIDASKATAIHLDVYVPSTSYTNTDWHEIGFGVIGGDGGQVWGASHGVVDDQWVTLEIPLTPAQAEMLANVSGLFLITNAGSDWEGPIYIDALRAVIPPSPPAAGE
jgi:hypothetical protein